MDSEEEDYEFNIDSLDPSEIDQAILFGDHRATTSSPTLSSSSDQEDADNITTLSKQPLIQAMDIPSVRRLPVSVMMPADRVSTHDLPLAESLSAVVEREKYHSSMVYKFQIGQL